MEANPTVVYVVAAALIDSKGRVLMQQRRRNSVHGGLWEFPGGKVEPGESPRNALVREIGEELALVIDAGQLVEVGFACGETAQGGDGLVILLYRCLAWHGPPRCLDGEQIAWVPPGDLAALDMPPLDYPLATQLLRHLRAGPD